MSCIGQIIEAAKAIAARPPLEKPIQVTAALTADSVNEAHAKAERSRRPVECRVASGNRVTVYPIGTRPA